MRGSDRRARRVLMEAAWTYARPALGPKEAALRATPEMRAIAALKKRTAEDDEDYD